MAPKNADGAPQSGIFLTAEWRHLAMLNYEVDPGLLRKLVPGGTQLDSWKGKTFLSLVGFRFLKTRVGGLWFPFHRNFDEVNLRFYVRRNREAEVKRGVVFIREIVPRWLISAVARSLYNERYLALPMRHDIRQGGNLKIEYQWRYNRRWNTLSLTASGDPAVPESGSEAQFITEHYWGYAAQKDGGCREYEVQHPPWKVCAAADARFEGSVEELYGKQLNAVLQRSPSSAFLAEGSPVSVHRGRRL